MRLSLAYIFAEKDKKCVFIRFVLLLSPPPIDPVRDKRRLRHRTFEITASCEESDSAYESGANKALRL